VDVGSLVELPVPTLYSPIEATTLAEAAAALELYQSQLERNDYARLLEARATANSVLGVERIFGFGSAAATRTRHAELFCEVSWDAARWWLGPPRILDARSPVASAAPVDTTIGTWLHQPSARCLLREADF
jgi:hypothetical protein